jgi:nanoRNase/pAp phosphatase (c-di-AMP/oligoRNAs hydrolase)
MAAGVLLAQRDLAVAANELERRGMGVGGHDQAAGFASH